MELRDWIEASDLIEINLWNPNSKLISQNNYEVMRHWKLRDFVRCKWNSLWIFDLNERIWVYL